MSNQFLIHVSFDGWFAFVHVLFETKTKLGNDCVGCESYGVTLMFGYVCNNLINTHVTTYAHTSILT